MYHHHVCNDHWHHYFLQPDHAVQATAQSSFLRCLWACNTYMFAAASGTTISCSLGRQYGPVLSLSFLDDYGCSMYPYYVCSGLWHNYFLQPGQAVGQCSVKLSYISVGTALTLLCLQWPLAQLFSAAWTGRMASAQSILLRCL
jgi:hypothetical protein